MKTPTLVTPRSDHIDILRAQEETYIISPVNVEPLVDYALVITASQETSRGEYWTGDLYHNGIKVACIENMGDGGSNRITEPDTGRWISNEWLTDFRAAANTAYGRPEDEAWEDTAILFLDFVSQLG